MDPARYQMAWTRRIEDNLVTLWLHHDACDDPVGGWDEPMPGLDELLAAAEVHSAACRGDRR